MKIKDAKKMMKKQVAGNSYLSTSTKDKKGREVFTAEFYKIKDFKSPIKLRHGQEVKMISFRDGTATLKGELFTVQIKDRFFIDYLKALNIDPVTVKLFMINSEELAFNIHSEKIESSKKVLNSLNLKINKRLPNYLKDSDIIFNKEKKELIYSEGKDLPKINLFDLATELTDEEYQLKFKDIKDGTVFKAGNIFSVDSGQTYLKLLTDQDMNKSFHSEFKEGDNSISISSAYEDDYLIINGSVVDISSPKVKEFLLKNLNLIDLRY